MKITNIRIKDVGAHPGKNPYEGENPVNSFSSRLNKVETLDP